MVGEDNMWKLLSNFELFMDNFEGFFFKTDWSMDKILCPYWYEYNKRWFKYNQHEYGR